jgi:N-acetylglutamate synthase-like GNAT family acetyltransferase
MVYSPEDFEIDDSQERLDIPAIHAYLTRSYWVEGIPYHIVEEGVRNSLPFGVYYKKTGAQVGFARLITDKVRFAYLADVYILEEYRGIGLSKLLMKTIMEHPDLQELRTIHLATKDAHGLYAQFGFKPLDNVERHMVFKRPGTYKERFGDKEEM